jgi:hypothetical protein
MATDLPQTERREIRADGLIVVPGAVDVHTHFANVIGGRPTALEQGGDQGERLADLPGLIGQGGTRSRGMGDCSGCQGRADGVFCLGCGGAPEAWQGPLVAELAEAAAGQDADLLAAAQALLSLLDAAGARAGKYTVDVRGAQGVQVGDYNRQDNAFHPPREARAITDDQRPRPTC